MKLIDVVENSLSQMLINNALSQLRVNEVVTQTGLHQNQVVAIFQKWAKKGAGRFVKGSRGYPSRFETAPLQFMLSHMRSVEPLPAVRSAAVRLVANK